MIDAGSRSASQILKESGSIYLHCDPTASHYLKLIMDAVFGPQMFRTEIIWNLAPIFTLTSAMKS